LAVSVRTQELQTATESLGYTKLERVVIGIRARLNLLNAAGNVLLCRQCRAERCDEHVRSAIVNRLVERDYLQQLRSLRTDVADFEQVVFRKLPLHVRVVLMNVRRAQFGIDEDAADRHADDWREGRQRRRNRRIHRKLSRLRHRNKRIRHRSQNAGQADRKREIRIVEQLRVRITSREAIVVDAVTAARDERTGVVQAISKTDAWREVVLISRHECVFNCWHTRKRSIACLHKTIWWTSRRSGCALTKLIGQEVDESPARINRVTVEVVTHAEVQRQSRVKLPIVLNKTTPIIHSQ